MLTEILAAEVTRYPSPVTGHVFISFDRGAALPYTDGLARFLAGAGVLVWYDREVGGEQRWAQALTQIQSCAAVVVVMTPGAEQSAWVAGEIGYAQQLGKPILPLLLDGAPFASLGHLPAERVVGGGLPGAPFVDQLRALAPMAQSPHTAQPPHMAQLPPMVQLPPMAQLPPTAPPPARRGNLVVGIVAGALGLLLVVVVAVGIGIWQLSRVTGDPASGPGTGAAQGWQEQAAGIDGLQDYLTSHPDWYEVDPTLGNHRTGRLTYPVDPPAGGLHNPVWQDCMGDVYPAEIPKERVMHSLEHGAVWVTYRPDLPPDQVERLAKRVRDVAYTLMSPYPGLDRPISLQAWGYQIKVDNAADHRIDEFLTALRRNAAPEPGAACSGGSTGTGSDPDR
jgi:Protein of unknown function (DUF3105)/TIR domain